MLCKVCSAYHLAEVGALASQLQHRASAEQNTTQGYYEWQRRTGIASVTRTGGRLCPSKRSTGPSSDNAVSRRCLWGEASSGYVRLWGRDDLPELWQMNGACNPVPQIVHRAPYSPVPSSSCCHRTAGTGTSEGNPRDVQAVAGSPPNLMGLRHLASCAELIRSPCPQ